MNFPVLTLLLLANLCLSGNTYSAPESEDVDPDALPDLVIDSLEIIDPIHPNYQISYRYTIKNVGDGPAALDGATQAQNVSVQAFLSWDEIFNNEGDLPAGGTILGRSPLGQLDPGKTRTGTFGCSVKIDPLKHRYLVIKVDWGERVFELDEENNTMAALFGDPDAIEPGVHSDGASEEESNVRSKPLTSGNAVEEWTNSVGHKIKATVLRTVGRHVIFKLENGEEVPYLISDLSEASQEKIRASEKRR